MDPLKSGDTPEPKGFEALLNQNEIAEARKKAETPQESLEERIKKAAPPPKNSVVRNIRTLKGDLEENISKGNTTLVSIASATGSPGLTKGINVVVGNVTSPRAKRIGLLFLAALLLFGGGGGIVYVLYVQSHQTVTINQQMPLIFIEKTDAIDTNGKTSENIRRAFTEEKNNASEQLGTILGIEFTKQATSSDGTIQTEDISTDELFRDLELNPSSRLARSIDQTYLVGIHIFDGNQPFILFKTTSYEAAFAGMLDWEKSLPFDIGPLFRDASQFQVQVPIPSVSTSTASTTKTTAAPVALQFEDMVYKNTDTRVVKNQAGKILLAYAFPSRSYLIITTNLETLGEIMQRLTSRQVVH